MCCAKTAEPIEMPFGELTHVGPDGKREFLGLSSPLKSIGVLLRCMQQKIIQSSITTAAADCNAPN